MNNIKIVSDSTCDLTDEQIRIHDICIVPLYVIFNTENFKDGTEINTKKLYEMVDKKKILPKTSAPSPQDFYDVFEREIEKGNKIIYIGLSSKLSSTIQNASIAAAEFQNDSIEIIDSENLSTGIGLLVMKAVDLRQNGMNIKQIAENIRDLIPKVRTRFIINTLDYLYKGGRCSALESFVGGLLKIRPIVTVKSGAMVLEEKIRGRREKILSNMLANALADKDMMDEARVFITHTEALEDAVYIKEELMNRMKVKEIIISNAGCVISSHCGPGTVGILYILK